MANKKGNKKPVKKLEKVQEEKKVKEDLTEEEIKEEFFDEKEDKESTFNKVMNVILWIVLFVWMAICLVDFFRTQQVKTPVFTFKHETTKYEDGTVDNYLGLGYRIFHYNRKCFNGVEYTPFWSKDRSVKQDSCSK